MDMYYIMKIIREDSLEENIKDKLCYFCEYYDFAGKRMDADSLPFYPLTPHTLLRMLEEELRNEKVSRNLEFLKSHLKKAAGKDRICREQFGFLLGLLTEHLLSDKEYALRVCQEMLDKMGRGNYAGSLCTHLEEILFDGRELTDRKEEIRYLVEALLVEQQLYGYSVKSIQQLLGRMFQGWQQIGSAFYTEYPFMPALEEGDTSLKVEEYMERLTLRDRIKDLAKLFEKQEQTYIFVCGVSGIKGENLDLEIGNVKLYNAVFYPKFGFERKSEEDGEEESAFAPEIGCPIHAAVTLCNIDKENFISQAKREVEKAIDVICCYSAVDVPIYIDMSAYIVLDEKENMYQTGMRAEENRFLREIRGLDYDRLSLERFQESYRKYSGAILAAENRLSVTIRNAVRQFRKGQEAQRPEDKLLNDWISLESLFPNELALPQEIAGRMDDRKTRFSQICGLVPTMLVRGRFFEYFWECHRYCMNLYFSYINGEDNPFFPISEELARKCDFKLQGELHIIPFLESLGEILAKVPDGVTKDYLTEVRSYVDDAEEAGKLLKRLEEKVEEELLMGYRLRNIIVHNAKSSTDYVEYYEARLQKISGDVIRRIIWLYEEHPLWTMEDILLRGNIGNREMKESVRKEGVIGWMVQSEC
ncbi:MAG: hypothetical protein NC341_06455 [Blautia sp.]|nr:hypothetical protein [Blautia sp.]MCM1200993.1 hypothetical protein [Bacteroides fragilis]